MDDPDATIIYQKDLNVDDILRKYGIKTSECSTSNINSSCTKIQSKKPKLKVYDLSDSEEDDINECISPIKQFESKKPDYFDALLTKPIVSAPIQKRRSSKSPNAANNILIAEQRAQKKIEIEKKKSEALKGKQIKKVLSDVNKQLKPDECIKFVTIMIDEKIAQNKETTLIASLKDLGCEYKFQSQIIPNSITWTRKVLSHQMDDNNTLKAISNSEEIPDLLLILSAQELIDFVKNKQLVTHVKSIQSIYEHKNVSLGVLELDKQLKLLKKDKKLSTLDVMSALTEIQLLCNCCYRNLNCDGDLAAMLCQFTKAIAQRPYKLHQQNKYIMTSWYMKGDNKDCVKVDKHGNGLKRLWQQHLTSFPLATLDIAESIREKYPTLKSLIEAYDNCAEGKEKENLLADINTRRYGGLMAVSRRLGNEMSKKISIFYNSLDGEKVLS